MHTIQLTTTDDNFMLSIPRNSIKKEVFLRLLEIIQIEMLAEKVNFDDSIESLGEEIVENWWKNNKNSYLNLDTQS